MAWIGPAIGAGAALLSRNKGGGGSQTTTQDTTPFNAEQLRRLYSSAEGAYTGGDLAQVAPFTPLQLQGQQETLDAAGTVRGLQPGILEALQFGLQAPDVTRNPALAGMTEAALRPIQQRLLEQILPNIRGEALAAGSLGGSRQGIAEGQAIRSFGNTAGDVMSRLINNIYTQGLTAQQRALSLSPGIMRSLYGPSQAVTGIGAQQQQQAQTDLDLPYLRLSRLQSLLSGAPSGSTSTTVPGPRAPGVMQTALGGAALGASIGNIFRDTPDTTQTNPFQQPIPKSNVNTQGLTYY